MKTYLFIIISFFVFSGCFAQSVTISGFVRDKSTHETLIGVNVYDTNSLKGTATNNFGFFSISFSKNDSISLAFSYIGYEKSVLNFIADSSSKLEINLNSNNVLQEVQIIGDHNRIERRVEMSTIDIPVNQIKTLPVLMGEIDVMRAFQLMPGVQSGKEGTSGIYVRGGSPDQNLFLLDDVPLYYVSHIGGFISTFDANAIKSIKLIKGGFPARYGGRLSSVIDIRMKEGNMKEKHGEYTIGILSSKISLEGPIKKDTSSYFISARRCNVDLITRPISFFDSNKEAMNGYTFYDVNMKLNRKLSDKNRVLFSFYTGRDKIFLTAWDKSSVNNQEFKYKYRTNIKWGNIMGSVRFNHIYNTKLFSNLTVAYTRFSYSTDMNAKQIETSGNNDEEYSLEFNSGVQDLITRIDYDYYPNSNNKIKFGAAATYHTFTPGISSSFETGMNTEQDTTYGADNIYALEFNVYLEDEIKLTDRWSANIGSHMSSYTVDENTYYSLQPRVSTNYLFRKNVSIKASYATMKQSVHLLSNSGAGLPTDLWVPATGKILPENSNQIAVGIAGTLPAKREIEISVEGFYKKMDNLIEYKEGTTFFSNNKEWEDKVEIGGKGMVYGIEFLLQKKEGRTTGWIGYTLSKNVRQFQNLNQGQVFPYKYDRRHDFSIVVNHKITDKISTSFTWVYGTGNALTIAKYQYNLIDNTNGNYGFNQTHIYNGRNSYRAPAFHKLDLSVSFVKKKKKGIRTLNISIYNAYNRKNPFFLYYKKKDDEMKLYQLSLFPFMPSISYNYKF
jgi:hypothetical protein